MKSKSRRYEVLLPARFNDGTEVPENILGRAVIEIVEQFNAVTFFKEAAEGYWRTTRRFFETTLDSSWLMSLTRPRIGNG